MNVLKVLLFLPNVRLVHILALKVVTIAQVVSRDIIVIISMELSIQPPVPLATSALLVRSMPHGVTRVNIKTKIRHYLVSHVQEASIVHNPMEPLLH